MLNLRPLDPACPIDQQLSSTADPVVLVNLFTVAEADIPALMSAWEKDALWMKQQWVSCPRSCTAPLAAATCS